MAVGKNPLAFRSREWRRRVAIPARVRIGPRWDDACILNLSTRGMMISTANPPAMGGEIEVCRADQVIRARVVWHSGARVGLRAEDMIAVDDILSGSAGDGLHLTAPGAWSGGERRHRPRSHDDNRLRGSAIEAAGVALIVLSFVGAVFVLAHQAFARPMAAVSTTLRG